MTHFLTMPLSMLSGVPSYGTGTTMFNMQLILSQWAIVGAAMALPCLRAKKFHEMTVPSWPFISFC